MRLTVSIYEFFMFHVPLNRKGFLDQWSTFPLANYGYRKTFSLRKQFLDQSTRTGRQPHKKLFVILAQRVYFARGALRAPEVLHLTVFSMLFGSKYLEFSQARFARRDSFFRKGFLINDQHTWPGSIKTISGSENFPGSKIFVISWMDQFHRPIEK